jgi:rubrerythrin
MEKKRFDEIIDFAIDKEKEAVDFYRTLQEIVSFEDRRDFLKELEDMEHHHIEILQDVKDRNIREMEVQPVMDLNISKMVTPVAITEDMSYQDLVITGMKREEAAENLYSNLAKEADDEDLTTVFSKLSNEEAKHKLFFEKLYDDEVLTED